eukprot:XP_011662259.1 PREDICTED: proto-oncogene tyrosine-protein kinase receptor Ret-like [Strongylocentrotus purpuratus]
MFELQETMGIVYVTNRTALRLIAPRNVTLYVECGSLGDVLNAGIIINLTITIEKTDLQTCRVGDSCSRHRNRADCLTHCGMGSMHGHCSWRGGGMQRAMSTLYATCTPDVKTCPDNRCDLVEMENRNDICPQDCTTRPDGFQRPINKSLPGIQVAIGPCWCYAGGGCMCMGADTRPPPIGKPAGPTLPIIRFPSITTTKEPVPLQEDPGDELCGPECYLGVCAGVFLTALITIILAVRKRRARRHQRRAYTSSIFKPPIDAPNTTRASMVLAEYADEMTSGRSFGFKGRFEQDSKWEFPLDKLLFEDELGEGHFGRVVRAQALSIRGHTGYTTVAVKMLKRDTATSAELHDLLTELELLKLLNHTNVIRLLGACIPKDPFETCVIVEYCKYGCLREFLRLNRKKALYTEYSISNESSSIPGLSRGKDVIKRFDIGFKEIASFAWQICKGMHYISSLKVVHRDLAARNVLVAEGLLLKISDFGLTRDVYERGLYERQSKSLLPVKWMAVEALYDNVFTVKSDVWSFGILLWEIVTMGAIPYPGVTAERLCQLLRDGYRMDRPEECSEELYTIMKQCWSDDPQERPSFEKLGLQFEKMLEETMEYLDLSDINGDLSSDEENEEVVECHKEQCCLLRKNRDDQLIQLYECQMPATETKADQIPST